MIYLRVGLTGETVSFIDAYSYGIGKEIYEDPLIRDITKDLDDCQYIGDNVFQRADGRFISFDELSDGSRTLIEMHANPDNEYDMTNCGDNCFPWLIKMSKLHDIKIATTRFLKLIDPKDSKIEPIDIICVNTGTYFNNFYDFVSYLLGSNLISKLH